MKKIQKSLILTKLRKKNLKKVSENKESVVGGRVYFDTSSIRHPSAGGAKFWVLFVDEATGYKRSYFMKKKSEMRQIGEKYLNFFLI